VLPTLLANFKIGCTRDKHSSLFEQSISNEENVKFHEHQVALLVKKKLFFFVTLNEAE